MEEAALQFLNELHDLGYVGYIVGGYPRDKYLGIYTDDLDICTNMTPHELKNNFQVITSFDQYGSLRILYEGTILEVTTFRKDGEYKDKRRPSEVKFVKNLKEDLKRRDFIINTLCIDRFGEYVDLLDARKDIDQKIIRVVGDTFDKLTEDPLRMLRAIRFSANLGFELDDEIKKVITNHKELMKWISDYHQKEELEKVKDQKKFDEMCKEFKINI